MKEPLKTYNVDFPSWGLGAIFNDDFSGLDNEDCAMIHEFLKDYPEKIFSFDSEEDSYFCSHPEFGLACDCVNLTVSFQNSLS